MTKPDLPMGNPFPRRTRGLGSRFRSLAAFCLVLLLGGCGEDGGVLGRFLLKTEGIIVERVPDAAYEQLFPHYVELCSLSQWSRTDGSGRGNPFGHALMYIKGACKDDTAPFPQLRRCDRTATAIDDPEHGAGVSVGRWFRNVNWVAIPGYELFFSGNLKPGERLTQAHLDATVQRAIDVGVFRGVELHDGWQRSRDWGLTEYVADQSVGTDFALQFSRNVFCARVPVTEPVLDEVIAFFNDKNKEYATGKADYHWNLLAHNCVHTVRNALAAANFWAPISVFQVKFWALFNLAVPANEFINLAILGADGPLAHYRKIFADGPPRDSLHDFHWLPTRHGALVKTMPVHQPNDIYTTRFRLFAVQSPFSMGKTRYALRLLSDPRYVDLHSNLLTFRDKYDAILAQHDYRLDPLASVRGTPYRRIERLHYDYIQAQRAEVDALLQQLAALQAAAPAAASANAEPPAAPGEVPAPAPSPPQSSPAAGARG
jgi:hypothetical protein